jgi:hypothetical protein
MTPETEKQFFDLSNSFIKLANDHATTMSPARVSAGMMYAAARYNSHTLMAATPNFTAATAEDALRQLVSQYEKMCRENIVDHVSRLRQATTPGT